MSVSNYEIESVEVRLEKANNRINELEGELRLAQEALRLEIETRTGLDAELRLIKPLFETCSREEFARRTQCAELIEKCRGLMEERNRYEKSLTKIFEVVSGQMSAIMVDMVCDPVTGVWVKA